MSQQKAIVIGAGIAGMATAIRLAVQGFQVTVFERNDHVGGKLHHIANGDFQFDAGPSLFTKPQLIEELFALANEPIEEYFSYQRLPITCTYFYEDGTLVNAYAQPNLFANELQEKLGEDVTKVEQYLEQCNSLYNNVGSIFLNHSLHQPSKLPKAQIAKAVKATKWSHLFRSMYKANQTSFSNSKTVQLFNRYATYNGSNPYKAPSMLNLIAHLEHNEGAFYPTGGMVSIAKALHLLALKKGVEVKLNTSVERIIEHDGKALGVVANGANIYADVVVSNMDVYFTYKHLLQQEKRAKKILKQERSSSALILYWGMKQGFDQMGLHNIFFTKDYKAEFTSLFKTKTFYADPTVYVNITSKCEPNVHAPAGKENWFVMVNAPANVGQDWPMLQQQYKEAILNKLSKQLGVDIASLIETEQVLDPAGIEAKTASYMGSLYGTSSNSKMAAFLRHPNFSKQIQGLYFVGGSVHPGGGIPLCLSSAKIASDTIAKSKYLQKLHQHAHH